MNNRRAFAFYDKRTGKRVGASSLPTLVMAEKQLAYFKRLQESGKRKDLTDVVPHLGIVELTSDTWGAQVGDVIAET